MSRATDTVFVLLQTEYYDSEVTSGEFIHTVKIPDNILGNDIQRDDVIEGIQRFLDWDDSDEEFDVIKFGKTWYTTQHFSTYEDFFEYDGVRYPTKTLTVTIDNEDDWVHSYIIAPESLIDKIQEYTEETGDERFMESIDSQIYHYVIDEYWDEPNEVIAKEYLDTPMTLVVDEPDPADEISYSYSFKLKKGRTNSTKAVIYRANNFEHALNRLKFDGNNPDDFSLIEVKPW